MKKMLLLVLTVFLFLPACASKHMAPVLDHEEAVVANARKSVVIFMRPSDFGGGIQSSVFDVTKSKTDFIGIVSSNSKIAYVTKPGKKKFMVVSEAADFISANLKAGKTYYVLVSPRMGWWKARFSLKPITAEQLKTKEFKGWDNECRFVRNTPQSRKWAQENQADIEQKRAAYFIKWKNKPAADRPRLKASDGIVRPWNK